MFFRLPSSPGDATSVFSCSECQLQGVPSHIPPWRDRATAGRYLHSSEGLAWNSLQLILADEGAVSLPQLRIMLSSVTAKYSKVCPQP